MKSSFITWYPQCHRSDSLAAALGGKSHLIHYLGFKRPWLALLKYPLQALATFIQLYRDKPELILVATPPVLAALPVYVYARLKKVPFVIDAHTGAFESPWCTWLSLLSRWMSHGATATIVTNEYLASLVQSWGARAVVIGFLPHILPPTQPMALGDGINIAVINTFSDDEPVQAVVEAARKLSNVTLHITGNLRRAPRDLQDAATQNVRFTGWLTEEAYASLLRAATAIMVLTTRDHTMQGGGNEAMALEKPLIISDWPLLRQTFSMGTVYVDNTPDGIVAGVEDMLQKHGILAVEMRELRNRMTSDFKMRLDNLLDVVKQHNLSRHLGRN